MNLKVSLLCMSTSFALAAAPGVLAQTVYRIVGADGKVTFSDKPPASPEQGKVAGVGVGAAGSPANASLPFELRQVMSKYPVTLYTAKDCAPCASGRNLLTARGIPFNERTISSPEDGEALQRLSGENTLPFLTLGTQRIKGFSDVEWSQYLDAAGYPKSSALPATYRNPPASPLVAIQTSASPATESKPEPQPRTPPPVTPQPSGNNPAGIVF